MKIKLLSLLVLGAAVGGCSSPSEPSASAGDALVGGTPDLAHPAVGYLVGRVLTGPQAGQIVRGFCTATLVAPNAVLTPANCVDPDFSRDVAVTGVGFGDVASDRTYEIVGAPADWYDVTKVRSWTNPESGVTRRWIDARHDVAVVPLREGPPGIAPVALNVDPIAPGTAATAISYGKIVESTEADPIDALVTGAPGYPRIRHAVPLEIASARNFVEAYPREDDTTSGVCFRDYGAPLVLGNGAIAGVLSTWSEEAWTAAMFDGLSLCRKGTGAKFINFRFGSNVEFVAGKLAALAEQDGALAR